MLILEILSIWILLGGALRERELEGRKRDALRCIVGKQEETIRKYDRLVDTIFSISEDAISSLGKLVDGD